MVLSRSFDVSVAVLPVNSSSRQLLQFHSTRARGPRSSWFYGSEAASVIINKKVTIKYLLLIIGWIIETAAT